MPTLYVTSLEEQAGKTALCAALVTHLKAQGSAVAYCKPLRDAKDQDAPFVNDLLGSTQTPDALLSAAGTPIDSGLIAQARDLVARAAAGAGVVIVEGTTGDPALSNQLAEALQAQVVLVIRYRRGVTDADITKAAAAFGNRLLGVVLNAIPAISRRIVDSELVPALKSHGLRVLAVVPEDRRLLAVPVRHIAEQLGASYLLNEDQADRLIEHFMIGAFTLDSAIPYFERISDKAVITRGSRMDVLWCALETPTSCLILTNSEQPSNYIIEHAREDNVPVLTTQKDTLAAAAAVEQLTKQATAHHPAKAARYQELLKQHGDIQAFFAPSAAAAR
ncbi:MAG: phosphotransacetylase family protein [Chloroflexi bacterium]|nr:phosphotransacetylase family protein [Chloroflexota bacterium]